MAELFGCPFKGWEGAGGGNFTYVSYNTGMCCQNGWILHKKICKHGSHFDPPKDPETWVKFVENRSKNHGENFGKLVGLHSLKKKKKKKLAKSLSKHGSPFSFVFPKKK